MKFFTEDGQPLEFSQDQHKLLPEVLPGSELFSASNESVTITLEEYNGSQFKLSHGILDVHRSLELRLKQDPFAILLRMGLSGRFGIRRKAVKTLWVDSNDALLFHSTADISIMHLKSGTRIRFLDAMYGGNYVHEMQYVFPALGLWLDDMNARIYNRVIRLNYRIREILHQIMHCPYSDQMQKYFFELKVKEILFELLSEHFRSLPEHDLSEKELASIRQAQEMITGNLRQHYTIAEISRKVNLNERKLKYGFRQLFGKGIFETLKSHRLDEAKMLLRYTDKPLKEIAVNCGYARLTSFITAFRNEFGLTPSEFRKSVI